MLLAVRIEARKTHLDAPAGWEDDEVAQSSARLGGGARQDGEDGRVLQ